MKTCSRCKETKEYTEYTKNGTASDGLYSMCKECKRDSQLHGTYGITKKQYSDMFEEQKGCCAICDKHIKQLDRKRLFVDHCHDTQKVRGLLCQHCNFVLGHARDDINVLFNAIQYLRDSFEY